MRDPERIDKVLAVVRNYWKTYPDMRLGQIVSNAAAIAHIDIHAIEDDKLMTTIQQSSMASPIRISNEEAAKRLGFTSVAEFLDWTKSLQ